MKGQGFSVLEILVAVSIITLAVTIVTFSFSELNSKQALEKSATLVVSILNEARQLTLSSVGDSQYGVHLEDSLVVLFEGPAYLSSDPSNIVTELNSLVGIRDVVLSGGGTSVVFERLTGDTSQTGTAELFLKADPGTFLTVTVSGTGLAESD